MPEERKPPDTDSEDDGKCLISITSLKLTFDLMNHEKIITCFSFHF